MGIKKIKRIVDLPFEVGNIYMTKFATNERFLLTKLVTNKHGHLIGYEGIYENYPHLGKCPLDLGRLVAFKGESKDYFEVCDNCGFQTNLKKIDI